MMRWRKRTLFSLLSLSVLLFSCESESLDTIFPEEHNLSPYTIELHWYQNDTETRAEFEIGMQWCFSFLGASLESGSWSRGAQWISDRTVRIDFKEIGFNTNSIKQFERLIKQYKQSQEYGVTGGIDAGRFVVSIINNSNHYYKIVNMPATLNAFRSNYAFLQKRAAIIESAVAFKERLIHMPIQNENISSLGYWAEELSGSLTDSSHQTEENEVMDILPNGQLRFGIYDKNGELIGGADSSLSIAGKPVKCLWCHETNIQRGFSALTEIPGYFTPPQFDSIIQENRKVLNNHRASLSPEIDFNDITQHPEFEKIYIRFLEPSLQRLSQEWEQSTVEVASTLMNIQTHLHDEFPELGKLYFRDEIEQYAPYETLPSVNEARETEKNEPNLLP